MSEHQIVAAVILSFLFGAGVTGLATWFGFWIGERRR